MNPVNITIVTFNRLEMTKICVQSLLEKTRYPYILTIIDNGSKDGTPKWLEDNVKKHCYSLKLLEQNIGIAKASNIGWKEGPKDYYLKLDNDIALESEDWLNELVDIADKIDRCGCVAHNVEAANYPEHVFNNIKIQVKGGNVGGCCCLIPQRTWEKLGYWCEDYGLYGEEDADYGLRILIAGLLNIYTCTKGKITHIPDSPKYNTPKEEAWYVKHKKEKRDENLKIDGGKFRINSHKYSSNKNLKIDI